MKVAVVTPFHKPRDRWFDQCLESVHGQTHPDCFHVLVGDGVSLDPPVPSKKLAQLTLSHNIGDYGDSPRTLSRATRLEAGQPVATTSAWFV